MSDYTPTENEIAESYNRDGAREKGGGECPIG